MLSKKIAEKMFAKKNLSEKENFYEKIFSQKKNCAEKKISQKKNCAEKKFCQKKISPKFAEKEIGPVHLNLLFGRENQIFSLRSKSSPS